MGFIRRAATSRVTTTHTHGAVLRDANRNVNGFQISYKTLNRVSVLNGANDVFHFFNRFIFSVFWTEQDLAPFFIKEVASVSKSLSLHASL
jgi:hypothetical protein